MIQDLHSHTYYSFCGGDRPEEVADAALAGGIEVLGITDHNYGVGYGRFDVFCCPCAESLHGTYERTLRRYYDHINLLREKYRGKIEIKRGIELCTLYDGQGFKNHHLPDGADISYYDYCLIENLDHPISVTHGDVFSYAERCATPTVGIAHTDMFAFIKSRGEDPYEYFCRMAEKNIFWEMNVSYDPTHNYRVHGYVTEFFKNGEQQDIVRRSGVRVSVGFDGHRAVDYLPDRVRDFNNRLTEMGILKPFE